MRRWWTQLKEFLRRRSEVRMEELDWHFPNFDFGQNCKKSRDLPHEKDHQK